MRSKKKGEVEYKNKILLNMLGPAIMLNDACGVMCDIYLKVFRIIGRIAYYSKGTLSSDRR